MSHFLSINGMKGMKTGGRKPGSKNVISRSVKEMMAEICRDYDASGLAASDFQALEPKERLYFFEKFANYLAPKMQAVELSGDEEHPVTIEERLKELAVRVKPE